MAIDFTGQVAIVTGAGGGLGRSHARMLAQRGARVVVNDFGDSRDGATRDASRPAVAVAAEIVAAGGQAIADTGSVTDLDAMTAMVARAIEHWGRVDILINNAGILRDKSFAAMPMGDFAKVVDVHLTGAANCTHAVWGIMRAQGYGRIVMTTSAAGLFGNFGQANYSAAKMGLVGLTRTLALEGAKYDIRVNALAPLAATRMLAEIMPHDLLDRFPLEDVSVLALYLASRDAPQGMICGAGAGVYHAIHVVMTGGVVLPEGERTPEGVAAAFPAIMRRAGETVPQSGSDQAALILRKLDGGD